MCYIPKVSTIQTNCRVKVGTDDGPKLGRYVGDVTVYAIYTKDNIYASEENPGQEAIDAIEGKLRILEENPKLVLDDGRIFYGCQVFWGECPEEDCATKKQTSSHPIKRGG